MTTNFTIDHIVIMVSDLSAAIQDYTNLGFTVLEGGVHADNPTHNALIVFTDGSYIEIIALQPGKETAPRSERLQKWVQASPGLVDMALLPHDIEVDIAQARQRGLMVEDAEPGGRLRPDGAQIAWKTANLGSFGLPFLCGDVTPRALRVPEGTARQQTNGVIGVANVTIAVSDLSISTKHYGTLLGQAAQSKPADTKLAAEVATFTLAATTLTLAQPLAETSPLHAYIAKGGERPYCLTLQTEQPPSTDTFKAVTMPDIFCP